MSFDVSGNAYDRFMGRYSRELAPAFADFAGVEAGQRVRRRRLRLGRPDRGACPPRRAPTTSPAPIPSPLLDACAERVPGADLKRAGAEDLPWPDDSFDAALAQLVVHFMTDPEAGIAEMAPRHAPGRRGRCLHLGFLGRDEAASAPSGHRRGRSSPERRERDETRSTRLGSTRSGEEAGLGDVEVDALVVSSRYEDFDELWETFLLGVGPAGQHLLSQPPERQAAIRAEYFSRLGEPAGAFELDARAWAVRGVVPE